MKFLSSFIKHSLQPARRGDAEFPGITHADPVPQVSPATENLNPPFETAKPIEQAPSISADSSVQVSGHKTALSESTTEVSAEHEAVPGSAFKFTSGFPPENDQVNISSSINHQSVSSQPIAVESIRPSSLNVQQETTTGNSQHITRSEAVYSTHSLPENRSTADALQLNEPDSAEQSGYQLENSQTLAKDSGSVGHNDTPESRSKPVDNSTDGALDSNSQETPKQSTIVTEQPTAIAVPVKQEATPPKSPHDATTAYVRDNRSANHRPAETPQVKIGNINILIDDQAAPKPAAKPASTPAIPSIPFGLRGL